MRFRWDPAKDFQNRRLHGISFDVAKHVFADDFCLIRADRMVDGEQRWHAIGIVDPSLLLVVVHAVDGELEDVIRLISARKAENYERRDYEDGGAD